MNCYRCQKTIRTPNAAYPVQLLVDMCRKHCLDCNPECFPRPHEGEWHIDITTPEGTHSPLALASDFVAARRPADEPATQLSDEAEDAVRKLLGTIAALDREELTIMHGLLNERSYSEIAEVVGRNSRESVRYKIKTTIKRHPWMNALRCRKAAKAASEGR